jgi:integrase
MRRTMTDKGVAALKPRAQRYAVTDPELRGHWIRIQPTGAKSYWAVTRNPQGKQVWSLVGPADAMGIEAAREQARSMLQRVRAGLPAVEPKAETFAAVAENWLKRQIDAKGAVSAKRIRRLLIVHVLPRWKDRGLTSIRRSDIAALLDEVEDGHGARQADLVLTVVRSIMNWYATRSDAYAVPVVRGMARDTAKPRERTLTDEEIAQVWQAAGEVGTYGKIIRICLLTGQRLAKVAGMRWEDVDEATGTWTVPQAAREKGTGGALVLPEAALVIIRAQPRFGNNPHVFTGRTASGCFNGLQVGKYGLDKKLPADMPAWVVHDLRRSARSLMARAGVRPDIAERVLGHVVGGVEGIYNRHTYLDEKAEALAKLAALIDSIVHPRSADVVPMRAREGKRR